MIFEYIQNIRRKSVAERQRVTLFAAVSATGVIVCIWLTVLIAGNGLGHYRFTTSVPDEPDTSHTSKERWGNMYPGAQGESLSARNELQELVDQYSTEHGQLQRAFQGVSEEEPNGSAGTFYAPSDSVQAFDTSVPGVETDVSAGQTLETNSGLQGSDGAGDTGASMNYGPSEFDVSDPLSGGGLESEPAIGNEEPVSGSGFQ